MRPVTQSSLDVIAEAIYDDGELDARKMPPWAKLSSAKRAGWLEDAGRVLKAYERHLDWLQRLSVEVRTKCHSDDPGKMCSRCDCWKLTRENCS